MLSYVHVEGMGPSLCVEGASNRNVFEAYAQRMLAPELCAGQLGVIDTLSAHKGERVKELIESAGCKLLYLPSYSPGLNSIEEAFRRSRASSERPKPARGRLLLRQ